jgi:hypothetical protein
MTEVTLEMVAAGETEFRQRCFESFRGMAFVGSFAPSKAFCEAAAIAIYAAMQREKSKESAQ